MFADNLSRIRCSKYFFHKAPTLSAKNFKSPNNFISTIYPSILSFPLILYKSPLYKKAPTKPANPRTKPPAPTNSFFAPLLAEVVAEAPLLVVVVPATLTAPLDPVVAAPDAVPASVVVADTTAETEREIALLVEEEYREASAQ